MKNIQSLQIFFKDLTIRGLPNAYVKELFSDGLNKTQIGQSLGLHRQTVSKYLSMTEEEFMSSQSYDRHYGHKLDDYAPYVISELRKWSFLSAPQFHDRLKEHFADLPCVTPKTVFDFVNRVRVPIRVEVREDEGEKALLIMRSGRGLVLVYV